MGRSGNGFYRRGFGDGNVAQWIKELDRQLELFLKELTHIRHAGASATKENALRPVALLLRAVMTDRTHQLGVQSRHRATHNLGHPRHIWIGRLGIRPAQADKAVTLFPKLGSDELFLE